MSELPTTFDTSHNEAFRMLGALEPGQQWSAFDVPRDQARAGKATKFVTTIWNFHWMGDDGHRTITERAIARDETDGTLWYRIPKPPAGAKKTWVAHWNGFELALNKGTPIVGVLKDVHSNRCSLNHLFDCGSPRRQVDGSAMWLQLKPRGQVGCEVEPINIREVTAQAPGASPPAPIVQTFEMPKYTSGRQEAGRAAWRVASMVVKAGAVGVLALFVMLVAAMSGSPTVAMIGLAIAVMAFLVSMGIVLRMVFGALWKLLLYR